MEHMNKSGIKRHYLDMRLGNQTIAPAIQLANFLMLSYLTISEIIPIYIFAPLFIMGILTTYTVIGNKFRHIQQSTDLNLGFEKASKAAMVNYQLFDMIKRSMKPDQIMEKDIEVMEYLKKIKEQEI